MGTISAHFDRHEFKCKCGECDFDTVDTELIRLLEAVRHHFMQPVTITSGCRCKAHNAAIGGSKNSQHIYGRAADIKVKDTKPADVYAYLNALHPNDFGLGLYSSWVHVDSRTDGPARW